jgi:hypothetical protein
LLGIREDWSADYLSEADRKFHDTLRAHFTVYRAQDAAAPAGLSWTLDHEVGAGFARGHRGMYNERPVIIAAKRQWELIPSLSA